MGRSSGCGPVQPKDQALEGSAGSLLMQRSGDFSAGLSMNGQGLDAQTPRAWFARRPCF